MILAFEQKFATLLNELQPEVKLKAVEIAEQLISNKTVLDDELAIKEGIKQAEAWFLNLEG